MNSNWVESSSELEGPYSAVHVGGGEKEQGTFNIGGAFECYYNWQNYGDGTRDASGLMIDEWSLTFNVLAPSYDGEGNYLNVYIATDEIEAP